MADVQREPLRLIVGLGNPGSEYRGTRHNAGFEVVESFLSVMPEGRFTESSYASSRVFTGRYRGKELILAMPQTYMNLSGEAVRPLLTRNGIQPSQLLVISDDLDLALGKIRLRTGGSSGGHNGLKSIIGEISSEGFNRLRIGIGRPEHTSDGADYVLSGFTGDEAALYLEVKKQAVAAIKTILASGMTRAMNDYNKLAISLETDESKSLT